MKLTQAAIAIVLAMPVPAMALERDAETAKTMLRCSVMMEDAANTADTNEAAQGRQTAAVYQMAAAAYTPGENAQASAQINAWVDQFRAELGTTDELTLEKQANECVSVHAKVQEVVEAMAAERGGQ